MSSVRHSAIVRKALPPTRRRGRQTAEERAREASAAAGRAKRPQRGGSQELGRADAAAEGRRTWHYAKHVSARLEPDADVRVTRRHVRFAQREVLWETTRLDRVRKCGRVPIDQAVTITDNAGVAHYSGLATCGSIWACPVCSAKIRNARALEVSTGAANWDRAGGSVYMATFTMPHDFGMRLKPLLKTVADSFRAVISGRPWTRLRDELGIVGNVRSVEVTHGANGWHPHLHVLFFINHDITAQQLASLTTYLRAKWAACIIGAGYRVPHEHHGVDVTRCASAYDAGLYVAKTQDGRSVGNEVARGDLKQARKGGRTPFEILDDFRWTGDAADLALWHEYERDTKGHQAISFSKNLRTLLELADEKSDEEVAAAEVGGDALAVITIPQWKRVIQVPGLSGYLLDCAERGGLQAVNAALAAHGIRPAAPPP